MQPQEGRRREVQGELQLRSRLVLTAQGPAPCWVQFYPSLENMMRRALGSGCLFLVADDTVNTGLRSEWLYNLRVPFCVWIL